MDWLQFSAPGETKANKDRFALVFSWVLIPRFKVFMPELYFPYLYENNSTTMRNGLQMVAEIISLDGTAILKESR